MKLLIAGLGNPGGQYELTRHNIGFLAVDYIADELGASFSPARHALVARASWRGKQLVLCKPTTFMNLSGQAIAPLLQAEKLEPSQLLVITDDIALPYARLRLRAKGSAGGHNGLKSTEELLQTQEYLRLRFGVGNDFAPGRQAQYVLSNFGKEELEDLPHHLQRVWVGVQALLLQGPGPAMTLLNQA